MQCSVAVFTEWSYEGKPKGCGLVGATASYRYMGAYMFVYALSAFVLQANLGGTAGIAFYSSCPMNLGQGLFVILKSPAN